MLQYNKMLQRVPAFVKVCDSGLFIIWILCWIMSIAWSIFETHSDIFGVGSTPVFIVVRLTVLLLFYFNISGDRQL